MMVMTEKMIEILARGMAPAIRAAIAAATQPLHDQIASLTDRVAEAESKGIEYHGVWAPGAYRRGAAVTWGGSLFIAMTATKSKPGESGEDSRAWKLAVKRGTDGKDAAR